jgi:ribosomal protein L40E
MEDILGYVLSAILDSTVPGLRALWGNWGCLMVSILAAGILFWFLPAYVLDLPGDDWKTWIIVGPLATIAVVVMVAGTYGLTRGAGSKRDEPESGEDPGEQEPADQSAMGEPIARNIKALGRAMLVATWRTIHTETKECPYCAETLHARAVVCRFCGRNTYRLASESESKSGGQGGSFQPLGAGPGGELVFADSEDQNSVCMRCGARNPDGSPFCGTCGAALDVADGPIS